MASAPAAFLLSPSQSRYEAFKSALPSLGLPPVRWLDVRQADAANSHRMGSTHAPANQRHHRAVLLAHAYAVELAYAEGAAAAIIFEDDARAALGVTIAARALAVTQAALQELQQSTQPRVLRLGYNPWPMNASGLPLTVCGCKLSATATAGLVRAAAGCNLRGAHAWALNRAAFLPFLRRINQTSVVARQSIDLTIASRFDNLLLTPPLFFQQQGQKTAVHERNYERFRRRCELGGAMGGAARAPGFPSTAASLGDARAMVRN